MTGDHVSALRISEAETPADFAEARSLFEEYAAAIGAEVCLQNFSRELDELRRMYGPPGGVLLLACAGEAIVGSVGLRPFGTDACEMKRLWVRPAARGNDVGRRLTSAAIQKARPLGYRRMLLDTRSSMQAARSLYLSLGFRAIAPYYDRPLEEITCYELLLNVTYRSALLGDAEQIALLHAESWRRTYRGMMRDEFLDGDVGENRRAVWRERLSHARDDVLVRVALDGQDLLGFIYVHGNEDATRGSLIDNLHVAPVRKRGGIGTALVREAATWLRERYPDAGVYLWVMEANAPARRFYEKLGARHAGTVDNENPGGGSAPECRYVWSRPEMLCRAIDGREPSPRRR